MSSPRQPRTGGEESQPRYLPIVTHLCSSHVLKRAQGFHPGLHGARPVTLPASGWEEHHTAEVRDCPKTTLPSPPSDTALPLAPQA